MSDNFTGSFLYASDGTAFPMKYIAYDTYKCTPKQREEIKAYRDTITRALHRITATGMKTKITFSTRTNLHREDKQAIMNFFTSHEVDNIQRKIYLKYWDEEHEQYDTGYFYRPNIDFTVRDVFKTSSGGYDFHYAALDFELIEY